MDLVTLSEVNYAATDLIEGWNSLIWAERYLPAGDFKLTTNRISETMAAMPVDGLVSLLDTDEVMIIENHAITNDGTVDELTVSGRTFETVFEERAVRVSSSAIGWETSFSLNAAQYITTAMYRAAPAGTANSFRRASYVDASDGRDGLGVGMDYAKAGDFYTQILAMLKSCGLGIRNVRPPNGSGNLRVELYNGVKRTLQQLTNDQVYFRHDLGSVDNSSYLLDIRDYKNVANVISPAGFRTVYAPGVSPSVSGRKRKVLQVEVTDLEAGTPNAALIMDRKGKQALAEHNNQAIIDGQVPSGAEFKYKEHYDLGDTVSVQARYGGNRNLMISEFIRTADVEGDRGYPTWVSSDLL